MFYSLLEDHLILHGCYDSLGDVFLDPAAIGKKYKWESQTTVEFQSWYTIYLLSLVLYLCVVFFICLFSVSHSHREQVQVELNQLNPIQMNAAGFIIRHQNDWYRLLSPRFSSLKGLHPFNDSV
jgi:hypothetical protein